MSVLIHSNGFEFYNKFIPPFQLRGGDNILLNINIPLSGRTGRGLSSILTGQKREPHLHVSGRGSVAQVPLCQFDIKRHSLKHPLDKNIMDEFRLSDQAVLRNIQKNWQKVDLRTLGFLDKIVFSISSLPNCDFVVFSQSCLDPKNRNSIMRAVKKNERFSASIAIDFSSTFSDSEEGWTELHAEPIPDFPKKLFYFF
ncbi:hypothetical protein SCOR_02430 [Sulfidibacter corallicola]|uniref:Uncharacterized protein n=1 Tax=Sulfidibacter corallicola TaxID=2818388 RepID=A0A8A4TET8_SULCO|nr:DUF4465 domain-containing protein [Sulfidibacter corallicola]QTD48619.1 hypothetical protein J3U87_23815 [Sulfidibacter corallicola]